jgi:hypothetical protein
MTLRISERYVMALNLSLIAILAYFLALSVNDIILGRVAGGASMHLASLVGPARSGPGTRPRAFYDAISRRDIFRSRSSSSKMTTTTSNRSIGWATRFPMRASWSASTKTTRSFCIRAAV